MKSADLAGREADLLSKISLSGTATLINPLTALCHDIAFSRFRRRQRQMLCLIVSPLTCLGYVLHRHGTKGTETAAVWCKAG